MQDKNTVTGQYSKLETGELEQVSRFLEANAGKLETAELTVRRSAGVTSLNCDPRTSLGLEMVMRIDMNCRPH